MGGPLVVSPAEGAQAATSNYTIGPLSREGVFSAWAFVRPAAPGRLANEAEPGIPIARGQQIAAALDVAIVGPSVTPVAVAGGLAPRRTEGLAAPQSPGVGRGKPIHHQLHRANGGQPEEHATDRVRRSVHANADAGDERKQRDQ